MNANQKRESYGTETQPSIDKEGTPFELDSVRELRDADIQMQLRTK